MLSEVQMRTINSLVADYDDYVVYYYADYHDYAVGETRDSKIMIYCGSGFTYEDGTFDFGFDVTCYEMTYNKYLNPVVSSTSFTVPTGEIVYTDVDSPFPDLGFFDSRFYNPDTASIAVFVLVACFLVVVSVRLLFGR